MIVRRIFPGKLASYNGSMKSLKRLESAVAPGNQTVKPYMVRKGWYIGSAEGSQAPYPEDRVTPERLTKLSTQLRKRK